VQRPVLMRHILRPSWRTLSTRSDFGTLVSCLWQLQHVLVWILSFLPDGGAAFCCMPRCGSHCCGCCKLDIASIIAQQVRRIHGAAAAEREAAVSEMLAELRRQRDSKAATAADAATLRRTASLAAR